VCCVRDVNRFNPPEVLAEHIEIIEVDFLDADSLVAIPKDIDAAYYLMHSMSNAKEYALLEQKSASNFRKKINATKTEQVIYLGGIANEKKLSEHLNSRKAVEQILSEGNYAFTGLRAGIIIGSGSASFEIIRDLVEKLPIMVTPKWLNTKCQPIGIQDVLLFLSKTLGNTKTYNNTYDIGGPDVLTYKQMLIGYAQIRGLSRSIYTIPIMTPKLSSYWLYFVTSTSYNLAVALVNSMKIEVVCKESTLNSLLGIVPIPYNVALARTLEKIEQHQITSSWKDALSQGQFKGKISDFLSIPTHACFIDKKVKTMDNRLRSIDRIWSIGGSSGWYYANWLWKIRGYLDKLAGGVGLRRGRTQRQVVSPGDAIDFWRVLYADKQEMRLVLYAEMKLPGEAWLEFKTAGNALIQTATFRPKGLWGRLYWYSVYPFHGFIFQGMINKICA